MQKITKLIIIGFFLIMFTGCSDHGHNDYSHNDNAQEKHDSL